MDWNAVDANWKQVSLKLKEKWSALGEDELQFIDRTKDALLAKVQARTGLGRDASERQLDALIEGLLAAPESAEPARAEPARGQPQPERRAPAPAATPRPETPA